MPPGENNKVKVLGLFDMHHGQQTFDSEVNRWEIGVWEGGDLTFRDLLPVRGRARLVGGAGSWISDPASQIFGNLTRKQVLLGWKWGPLTPQLIPRTNSQRPNKLLSRWPSHRTVSGDTRLCAQRCAELPTEAPGSRSPRSDAAGRLGTRLSAQPPRSELEGTAVLRQPGGSRSADSGLDLREAVQQTVPTRPLAHSPFLGFLGLPEFFPRHPCQRRLHQDRGSATRDTRLANPRKAGERRNPQAASYLTPPTCPSGILDWTLLWAPPPHSWVTAGGRTKGSSKPAGAPPNLIPGLVYLHSNTNFSGVRADCAQHFVNTWARECARNFWLNF